MNPQSILESLILNRKSLRFGFTLVELLVVMAIISILVTLVTVTIGPVQRKSRDAKRKADLNHFITGLKLFESDFKVFPNHTFYLGKSADAGAANSNFELGPDLASCSSLTPLLGHPQNFAADANFNFVTRTQAEWATSSTYDSLLLKPGFASVNQFLICLKYADRAFDDATFTGANDYQYRINYDYTEFLVSAQLENGNDKEGISQLFTGGGNLGEMMDPKRYFEGNGRNARQLDDDSNRDDAVAEGGFYNFDINGGTALDGRYFYQCVKDSANLSISRDNRSDLTKVPITTDTSGSWVLNSGCKQDVSADANAVAIQSW